MFKKIICVLFLIYFFASPVFAGQNNVRFLTLSDIHFDPFLTCKKDVACPVITKLMASPSSKWYSIIHDYDRTQPQYHQETNSILLQSTLKAAHSEFLKQHPSFVLLLGDSLAHNYKGKFEQWGNHSQKDYEAFVKKTFEFLDLQFKKAFPNVNIYNVVGNNDSYADHNYTVPNGPFFHDIAAVWASNLKDRNSIKVFQNELPIAGYYSLPLPQLHSQLIVLNSVLFKSGAQGPDVKAHAEQELIWLQTQLAKAKKQNQKVIIALHIPYGIDLYPTALNQQGQVFELWEESYTAAFENLIRMYHKEVSAILSGHFHMDVLQVDPISENDFSVISTPGISPLFGNNPGFKIFSMNPKGVITDYEMYFTDLSKDKTWSLEYDFNKVYQPNCGSCAVVQGINLLEENTDLAQLYESYFAVGALSEPSSSVYARFQWCAIHHLTKESYRACIGSVQRFKSQSKL